MQPKEAAGGHQTAWLVQVTMKGHSHPGVSPSSHDEGIGLLQVSPDITLSHCKQLYLNHEDVAALLHQEAANLGEQHILVPVYGHMMKA